MRSQKAFDQACAKCLCLKNFRKSLWKITAQFLRVSKMYNLLPNKERKWVLKAGRPKGWRKNLLLRLRKTVFKEFTHEAIANRTRAYLLGRIAGIKFNFAYAVDGLRKDPDMCVRFTKLMAVDPDEYAEQVNNRQKAEAAKNAGKKAGDKSTPKPSEIENYANGMRSTARGLVDDDLTFTHARKPTDIQLALLIFSDAVDRAPNIYALWEFFRGFEDFNFTHSPESLEKICRRSGIRLALKAQPKKETPDRLKT